MFFDIKNYKSKLSLSDTFVAIKYLKDRFEEELGKELNLKRVSAPLFVLKETGLNDDLNGSERPVSFNVNNFSGTFEIVQSLAKWKRNALKKYNFNINEGLYTDMNAIRRDELIDNIHSIYVDQWDWEKIISQEQRNLDYLFITVNQIYQVLLRIEKIINEKYPQLSQKLPPYITFISSEELENKYPSLSRKEREYQFLKAHRAAFIYHIGTPLKDGLPHDGRAADYDDWGLNGDILVFDEILDAPLELSSMGIRVNAESLLKQIKAKHEEFKLNSPYHQDILNNRLPLTVGGGIGQSRLCLFFLEKAHVGEVQCSLWPEEDIKGLEKLGIILL